MVSKHKAQEEKLLWLPIHTGLNRDNEIRIDFLFATRDGKQKREKKGLPTHLSTYREKGIGRCADRRETVLPIATNLLGVAAISAFPLSFSLSGVERVCQVAAVGGEG